MDDGVEQIEFVVFGNEPVLEGDLVSDEDRELIKTNTGAVVGALMDGKIVGIARLYFERPGYEPIFRKFPQTAIGEGILVDRRLRRLGIGTKLGQMREDQAKIAGKTHLAVGVEVKNKASRALLKKLGFRKLSIFPHRHPELGLWGFYYVKAL